ncbi:MAG: hypothetical protein DHS20C16_23410 [Phycisphaerae bacterium]|nr:MAG: hypothetical protein DHS20C16_23410 [Phycisphaerae bacterium]
MNKPNDIRKAMAIFDEVCDLPPHERSGVLDRSCAGDTMLRSRVEQMLATEDDESAFLVESKHGVGARIVSEHLNANSAVGRMPDRIERYKIIRELGRGGMGVVYEAEQDAPKRRVALKLIQSTGMAPSLIKRFEREAFVLGQLQHPGIAHIYESGVAKVDGHPQPFLAMELVNGERITAYAKNRALNVRERLELMARVCDAVQHAHQKGVIHRDLKPANILVVEQSTTSGTGTGTMSGNFSVDDIGQTKVLDFGVARLTDGDVQAVTMQTTVGQIVGTLAYMSPEQVAGDPNGVDTRSDVYALGVVLFQLLTDRLPLDVSGVSVAEAARIIRDQDPTAVSTADRALRGDIETIVDKALEKDADRRYTSPAELSADLRRFLRDEPITARPASTLYQVRKFANRNRALVGGVVATFVALLVGLLGTGYYLVEAREQFARAENERDEAIAAREEAEKQRKRTSKIAGFQANLLRDLRANEFGENLIRELQNELNSSSATSDDVGPEQSAENQLVIEALSEVNSTNVARAVLSGMLADRALKKINEGYTKDPVTESRLRYSVAQMYSNLGMLKEALDQSRLTLELEREHLGSDHKSTLASIDALALRYRQMGRVAEAEELFRESLRRRRRVQGDDHKLTLRTMGRLAALLHYKGDLGEAKKLMQTALDGSERTYGPEDVRTLQRRNNYCALLLELGKIDEALACFQSVLETRERVSGLDHKQTIVVRNNLMGTLFKLGRFNEAEPVARDVLASNERVMGDKHPSTMMSMNNLGVVLLNQNRLNEAESLFRAACDSGRKSLNSEHEVRMKSTSNLIDALLALDRPAEAESYCHELIETRRSLDPPQPGLIAQTLEQLGQAHFQQKQYTDARDAWVECVELRADISNNHWLTNRARSQLGSALAALGQFNEAEALLLGSYRALDAQRDSIPLVAGANCLRDARQRIRELYQAWGKDHEADKWQDESNLPR